VQSLAPTHIACSWAAGALELPTTSAIDISNQFSQLLWSHLLQSITHARQLYISYCMLVATYGLQLTISHNPIHNPILLTLTDTSSWRHFANERHCQSIDRSVVVTVRVNVCDNSKKSKKSRFSNFLRKKHKNVHSFGYHSVNSAWVSDTFVTAHQHIIGYLLPWKVGQP